MKRRKLPESEIHENQTRKTKRFSKSLSPGQNWKSKSMRIIPEEILRSSPEGFEHRVVFTVPWNNSWQLWLQRDKNCLFMIQEDWDEFVDDNLLGSDHTLLFTHQDTMYFQVQIFKKDGKEIISAPLQVEPETEPVPPKPHNSHQETSTPASASGRGRKSFTHVEDPERYLFNPQNPYFEKTLTKTNTSLYVSPLVIKKYDLEFGPHSSSMYFLLPDGTKLEGSTKNYGGVHSFLGWAAVCQKYNLKEGDTVVCEFELSGGRVVTAVRVHFVTASNSSSGRQTSGGRQSSAHVVNPERYLLNPNNPYFEKTLTKTNNVLYVSPLVIKKYSLEFGPHSSSMYFLLPDGNKLEGFTKNYGGVHSFLGWAAVCQKYNLKEGDTVVCEFELSGGRVVTAVRVHFVTASNSASGRRTSGGRQSFTHVEKSERYLLNPQNPYFEKTLTKTNNVLYVSPVVIEKYSLEFGPHNSSMDFLLPDGSKLEGFTKSYGGLHGFLGWAAVCQKCNLKEGDSVVCEFELSGGRVVTAVRVHLVNE